MQQGKERKAMAAEEKNDDWKLWLVYFALNFVLVFFLFLVPALRLF